MFFIFWPREKKSEQKERKRQKHSFYMYNKFILLLFYVGEKGGN